MDRLSSNFRFYRRQPKNRDERAFQVLVEETDLWITTLDEGSEYLPEIILPKVRLLRSQIKTWMDMLPEFGTSLEPVFVPEHAPEIVRNMAWAGQIMGVGPMAAVAGALAECVAREFLHKIPEFIVENGGDTFMCSTRERVVALLDDPQSKSRLGVKLHPWEFPLSICSSSANIGHSLSLGQGDLVAVRAKSGALADAAATAFCNMLKTGTDVEKVTGRAKEFEARGIDGVFAKCGGQVGVWGKMELVAI